MIYQEIKVHPALQKYILCYWKFEVPYIVSDVTHIHHYIIPDGCASMVFCYHPHFSKCFSILVGPTKNVTETDVFAKSVYVGVRFRPGVTREIFGLSGEQLRDQIHRPAPNLPNFDDEKIYGEIHNGTTVFATLDEELLKFFEKLQPDVDKLVGQATDLIINSKGNLKIAELIRQLPLSERQLQKRFRQAVGLTLKEFATIMRVRASVIQLELEKEDYQSTVYNSGYFDQAHFIRDFSRLSNISLPLFKKYIKNIKHIGVKSKHEE